MNRDDIIRMVREALNQNVDYSVWTISTPHLEEFARLVAAAEREACAKVLDEMAAKDKLSNYYKVAALAIRERGAP